MVGGVLTKDGSGPANAIPDPQRPKARGQLVAVVAACGGAGATTLAYLLAARGIRSDEAPVLVCDTGQTTGGLAVYAGVASPRSLVQAARALGAGEALAEGLFAIDARGVRVIASPPALESDVDVEGLNRLLADAMDAHRLTVVDCGGLGGVAEKLVLDQATQVVWVLPATASGVRRAQPLLELLQVEPVRPEIVVARHDAADRRAPTEDLAGLAAGRAAPLILMPHVPDLAEREVDRALDAAALTLDAIDAQLARGDRLRRAVT